MGSFLGRLRVLWAASCAALLVPLAPRVAAAELQAAPVGDACAPEWIPTFGGAPGTNNRVYAMTVFDDGAGAGPALHAAGIFTAAGGQSATRIARWDGQGWSALGSGLNDAVYALCVFDDGSGAGPALYAGGEFTSAGGQSANRIAKWDGQGWSPLASGMDDAVTALGVFDDGSGAGPALYAGGNFTTAGGQGASRIARWDGQTWSALGSGMNAQVSDLIVFDDGSGAGPALYAGGHFSSAGGQTAAHMARWDGQAWSTLGSGTGNYVAALTVYDDGTAPALFAGGAFTSAGGLGANRVAKWDGSSWSPVGGGTSKEVFALTVFDDGAGPALYAGGVFTSAGGLSASQIAKWDGQTWSALGSGTDERIDALTVFDDGSGAGPVLFAGGWFIEAGGLDVRRIATWDGQAWGMLGTGLNGGVSELAALDDGSGGLALYAGGDFTLAGGEKIQKLARWDGATWSPLGQLNSSVASVVWAAIGSDPGPTLYAGGAFTQADGQSANRIARWDGQGWTPLGSGMDSFVYALAVFDDGSGGGPALYAAGDFFKAGGLSVHHIAKWDGQAWSDVGGGISGDVNALAVFDDGSGGGMALYAAGLFSEAGGQSAPRIARWDGQSWSAVGGGLSGVVHALAVINEGPNAGRELCAGGDFILAGGQSANRIAVWDGQSWSPLGNGMNNDVRALAVHDDGTGPALYAGGDFTTAGGVSANRLAKWDGLSWSPLGDGTIPGVRALASFDDGSGTGAALYAAGWFDAGPAGDSFLARWGCPAIDLLPGCSGNPAALASLTKERSIGGTLEVSLSADQIAAGLGLLFLGQDGTDAAGCGLLAPNLGELLLGLVPFPTLVGSSSLGAGSVVFSLPIPADPALVGLEVALQGAVLGLFDPSLPIELSNALLVTITQ